MKEWCMIHPYLTFILIVAILVEIETIMTTINNKTKVKVYELKLRKKDKEGI